MTRSRRDGSRSAWLDEPPVRRHGRFLLFLPIPAIDTIAGQGGWWRACGTYMRERYMPPAGETGR